MATADSSGVYNLLITATTTNGCVDTASIVLTVKLPFIGIPDAFTPNNDNMNDAFGPIGLLASEIKTFKVYNRWGQLIYDGSDSLHPLWDGTHNGVSQPTEVYVYLISYQLAGTSEELVMKGEVTLLR
jgi:gliding motility-associated-like protein